MKYNTPLTNSGPTAGEYLKAMAEAETEECEALARMVPDAIKARTDAHQHRWPTQSVLSVLSHFERMGSSGFSVTRAEHGLVFAPVGVPGYLREEVA